jgi:RNase P/RNase MRP subunit POP5
MEKEKIKRLKLKPSQRSKKRYFIAKASFEEIEKAILEYLGILGAAKANLIKVSQNIFCCNRESLNEVRASLALAGIKIEKVSGTIKGLGK